MNPEQMIQDLKLKQAIVDTNLEIIQAWSKLSPEDQKAYCAVVKQTIEKSEQLIKQ